MANEGSTKPTYSELVRALDIMTEKYKAEYGYVESAREERDQITKTCDLLRAENLCVRGLLRRGVELVKGYACSDPNCCDTGHRDFKRWLTEAKASQGAESADIGKLDSAPEKCYTPDLPEGFLGQRCGECDSLFPHGNFKFCSECGANLVYAVEAK